MNVMEQLVKSANQNHGRTLQPAEVRAVVDGFQAMNQQMLVVEGRLDAVTRIVGVMLTRLGPVAIQPAEFEEFENTAGFNVRWDEETDVIHVEPAQEEGPQGDLEVSELLVDDDDADQDAGGLPPVSEGAAE
jgi:hypothetical protein